MSGAIHHIDITVGDLDCSTRFYDQVMPLMGFRRGLDVPEGPLWAGESCEVGLVAAHRDEPGKHNRFAPGLHHLAFAAPTRSSVEQLHAALLTLGVPVLDAPAEYPRYAPGYFALFFTDPDGIKLEYVHTPHWPA
jgi:catechol 2,3-dioxygenase-like lactoylglutathione lyase family enzyme